MASNLVHITRRGFGETARRDFWWVQSLLTFLGFSAFIVYSTWAAFQGAHYSFGPYLSPMYSPLIWEAAGQQLSGHAWLGAWPGPVINRPSTTCLNGPGWRPEQWVVAATAVGLRACPIRRRAMLTDMPDDPNDGLTAEATRVTVVGGNWFGPVSEEIGHKVCRLAETVGCSTLEADLVDDVITQVSAWPDLTPPHVADALARVLDGPP